MRLYCIIIVLSCYFVNAQDSIQQSANAKKARWFEGFFIQNFDKLAYWQNGLSENFTTSSFKFNNYHKDLHLVQEAKGNTNFGVNTHGKWQSPNKKTLFSGNINISKEYLTNKAWNNSPYEIQANGIMPDPHYYLVQRAGNWSNIKYNISGAMQIPVMKKFLVQTTVKYNLEEKYRVNLDPRTEVSHNALMGELNLKYNISNNQIGLAYAVGNLDYSTDHNRVIKEQDTPYYYDKYLKWMWGYGQFFNNKRDNSRRDGSVLSIATNYTYKNDQNLIAINLRKTDTHLDNYDSKSKSNPGEPENNQFSATETLIYDINLYAQKRLFKNHQLDFIFSSSIQDTHNYLYDLGGVSYENNVEQYSMLLSHYFITNNLFNNYGFKFFLENYNQSDLLSETFTSGKILQMGLFAEKEYHLDTFNFVPYIELAYVVRDHHLKIENLPDFNNVSETDFLNLTRKNFYEEVVLMDHAILNQHVFSLKLEPEIIFISKKNYLIKFSTGFQSDYVIKQKKSNRYINLSLSINY